MEKKETTAWLITAKTNLHVGDENSSNYGLIDKTVQRDVLTNLPCINSSSLKGALNEYCCYGNTSLTPTQIHKIFGSDKKEDKLESQKGNTLFFDAHILFLPVQDNETLYKLAYCDEVLDQFIEKADELFEKKIDKDALLNKFPKDKLVHVSKIDEFKNFCSDYELPIIARNRVGENNNLWYEQVIPSEAIFYTFLQSLDEVLADTIKDKIVQIGANATIGYGYCKFTKIESNEKK